MSKHDHQQTNGRSSNAAEPLGDFTALGGEKSVQRNGKKARTSAGPDGPDAAAVGESFKARSPAAGGGQKAS